VERTVWQRAEKGGGNGKILNFFYGERGFFDSAFLVSLRGLLTSRMDWNNVCLYGTYRKGVRNWKLKISFESCNSWTRNCSVFSVTVHLHIRFLEYT